MDRNTCRLCLESRSLELDLFAGQNTEKSVLPKLEAMLKMPLPKVPDWPTMVCVECVQLIGQFEDFVNRVRMNQTIIAGKLSGMEIKEELSESENDTNLPSEIFKATLTGTRKIRGRKNVDVSDVESNLLNEHSSGIDISPKTETILENSTSPKTVKPTLRRSKRAKKDHVVEETHTEIVTIRNGLECDMPAIIKSEPMNVVTSEPEITERADQRDKPSGFNRELSQIEKVMQEMNLLNCDKCGEDLKNMSSLQEHYTSLHNTRGYVICCGKSYYHTSLLHDHIRFHMDKEAFKCNECGKCLANARSLRKHLQNMHVFSTQLAFECKDCGKGFRTRAKYEKHKVKHLGEEARVHKCTQCSSKFKTELNLKMHIKTQHECPPESVVCPICGSMFKTKSTLNTHIDTQHDGNSRKKKCDICGVYVGHVKSHKQRMHEATAKVTCEVCHKPSKNSFSLQCHMKRFHSGNATTYPCLVCHKVFTFDKYLQEHLSVHTGIKSYVCNFCPATFSCSGNKVKHHRIRHLEEWEKWRSERSKDPSKMTE